MAIEHIEKLVALQCPVCSDRLPKHFAGSAMVGALTVPPQTVTCQNCDSLITFQAHLSVRLWDGPLGQPLTLRTL